MQKEKEFSTKRKMSAILDSNKQNYCTCKEFYSVLLWTCVYYVLYGFQMYYSSKAKERN